MPTSRVRLTETETVTVVVTLTRLPDVDGGATTDGRRLSYMSPVGDATTDGR